MSVFTSEPSTSSGQLSSIFLSKIQFSDKRLFGTWSSEKEICFKLFSCLAPCQKCKITKQLMAPRSRCPGTVDNPTNKPDLAYCTLPHSVQDPTLPFSWNKNCCPTAPPTPQHLPCHVQLIWPEICQQIFFLAKSRSTPRGLTNWFRLNDQKSPRCGLLDYNLTYLRFGFSAAWHL